MKKFYYTILGLCGLTAVSMGRHTIFNMNMETDNTLKRSQFIYRNRARLGSLFVLLRLLFTFWITFCSAFRSLNFRNSPCMKNVFCRSHAGLSGPVHRLRLAPLPLVNPYAVTGTGIKTEPQNSYRTSTAPECIPQ